MKEMKNLIILLAKRLLFFTLPLWIFLYIFYDLVLGIDIAVKYSGVFIYIIIIEFFNVRKYLHKSEVESLYSLEYLRDKIVAGRWKILESKGATFILGPKFDFPYSILSRGKVYVEFSDGKAKIEGPEYYVITLINDIRNKRSTWGRGISRAISAIIIVTALLLPIFSEKGVFTDIRTNYHNYQNKDIELIEIHETNKLGNTVNNINNYGYLVESKDYIFYVENYMNLVRTRKDFQEKTYLIEQSSGTGINRLNIVDDWIFYMMGESIHRVKTDGSKDEIIYNIGYPLDMHVFGNQIYFISHSDGYKVYRMDVNGQDLERFVNIPVIDIAIYDNRLFYSYETGGEGFLESVDLDGQNKRVEMNIPVSDLVIRDNNYYYLGYNDYKLYRCNSNEGGIPQILVDGEVASYAVTDSGIYYSLHSENVAYPGEGLYKVNFDGSGNTLLYDSQIVEGLSQAGDWLLFLSADNNMKESLKKLDIKSDEILGLD